MNSDQELESQFSTLAKTDLSYLLSCLPSLNSRELALALISLQNAEYSDKIYTILSSSLNSNFPVVREGAIYTLSSFSDKDLRILPLLKSQLKRETNWTIKQALQSVLPE